MAFGIGRYNNCFITGTALSESKNAGAQQIVIEFQNPEDGSRICAYLSTTERAWPYTEEKLRACGWDPRSNGYRFEDLDKEPTPLAGNVVDLVCDEEEYEGKRHIRVKFINAPGAGGMPKERMAASEAKSFADKLRARVAGIKVPAGQPSTATARPSNNRPSEPWDEDPFRE